MSNFKFSVKTFFPQISLKCPEKRLSTLFIKLRLNLRNNLEDQGLNAPEKSKPGVGMSSTDIHSNILGTAAYLSEKNWVQMSTGYRPYFNSSRPLA